MQTEDSIVRGVADATGDSTVQTGAIPIYEAPTLEVHSLAVITQSGTGGGDSGPTGTAGPGPNPG